MQVDRPKVCERSYGEFGCVSSMKGARKWSVMRFQTHERWFRAPETRHEMSLFDLLRDDSSFSLLYFDFLPLLGRERGEERE